MASIGEIDISILPGNLNSSRSYLTSAVPFFPSSARKFPVDSMVCLECQNVVKDYLYLNHIRDTQKWSDCEICGLILSESLKRNRIQEFHSKSENWERLECDYCTNGLRIDQFRTCTKDKLFVCRVCKEGFFEIRNQILHIKRVHLEPTSVFIRGWFLSSWKMNSSSKFYWSINWYDIV